MRKVIEAQKGCILTNGIVYGRKIYLADGETGEDFYEITDAEYEALQEKLLNNSPGGVII